MWLSIHQEGAEIIIEMLWISANMKEDKATYNTDYITLQLQHDNFNSNARKMWKQLLLLQSISESFKKYLSQN